MAFIGKTSVAEILAIDYGRENYLAPHERFICKFYDKVQDFEDGGAVVGLKRTFEIVTADSHAVAGTAEGEDLPEFAAPDSINCDVSAVQIAGTVAWSDLMLKIGKGQGLITKVDIVDRYVKMTVRNLYSALNRQSLGHGTGRMAVVESATVASTTVPVRNPEHVYQLRKGMKIDFYDADTGGSKQGDTETIQSISIDGRSFVIGNARSLTQGWGIYKAKSSSVSEYGIAINGLRGMADNGQLTASIFGVTRSTTPDINANVLMSQGGKHAYSEALLRKAANKITAQIDMDPDLIICNEGIISEHLNHLTGSRVYQVTGDDVPSYQVGAKEAKLAFHYHGKAIPFLVDRDYPNGELTMVCTEVFRRHVTSKAGWVGDDTGADGSSTPVLMQAPGTGSNTYALQKLAGVVWVGNLACTQPKALVRVPEINDVELAGDQPQAA